MFVITTLFRFFINEPNKILLIFTKDVVLKNALPVKVTSETWRLKKINYFLNVNNVHTLFCNKSSFNTKLISSFDNDPHFIFKWTMLSNLKLLMLFKPEVINVLSMNNLPKSYLHTAPIISFASFKVLQFIVRHAVCHSFLWTPILFHFVQTVITCFMSWIDKNVNIWNRTSIGIAWIEVIFSPNLNCSFIFTYLLLKCLSHFYSVSFFTLTYILSGKKKRIDCLQLSLQYWISESILSAIENYCLKQKV